MKWLNVILLGVGMAGSAAFGSEFAESPDRYNVVWDSPSKDQHGSMPLGNGATGINAWIEPNGDLVFYIGRTDSWGDNGRLLKLGKVRIKLDPAHSTDDFLQTLSLADGTLKARCGNMDIRLWVDANHPVIHAEFSGPQETTATASIELWRTEKYTLPSPENSDVMTDTSKPGLHHAPTIIDPDTVLKNQTGRIGWYHRNTKSVGPAMCAKIQGVAGFKREDPLLHRTFGAVIKAKDAKRIDDKHLLSPKAKTHQFDIYVLAKHPATEAQWLDAVETAMAKAEKIGIEKRREEHADWWQAFWQRSWIHAIGTGDQQEDAFVVSRGYALQRYINACAARGAYPIKFNGSIFNVAYDDGYKGRPRPGGADYRAWGPGYWWQNTRLPYISMCTSGDFEMTDALYKMYCQDLFEYLKYQTKAHTGHDGIYVPENVYFWGDHFSITYGWKPCSEREDKLQESPWHKWEWVSGPELTFMMLDRYEHTLDEAFLKETIIPFANEILIFFDQQYRKGADGKLVMHPAMALETWWECTNPMPEVAGLHAITDRMLALPDHLTTPEQRSFWQQSKRSFPDLPTTEVNGVKVYAPAETFAKCMNGEAPELYSVFPFRLCSFEKPNAELGIQTLTHLRARFRGNSGWRQDEIFMAYLGLTEQAKKNLVGRAKNKDKGSRFPAFWGPNMDWIPDQDHGGVLLKAFQSMILQTDGKKIFIAPAWPKDWNAEFKLHAPYKTTIQGRVENGKLVEMKVTPASRANDVVNVMGARLTTFVSGATQKPDALDAASGIIKRLTPSIRNHFKLEVVEQVAGKDVYEIESSSGKIVLRGNNGVSLASAYGRYLRDYCKVHYSMWGDQMTLPDQLPTVQEKVRVVNPRQFRHFFNYCTFNYTATWWDWQRWERMIDILAMHGVNMPLAIVGVEGVWYHSLLEIGFTDLEARQFIAAPIYLNWQWMSNLEGTGGPMPKSYIDSHLKLGRQIMNRQISLGMTPIVHGFSGHVPRLFKEEFPESRVDIKHGWARNSFKGAAQLDPMDPLFERFGLIYLKNQIKLLGTAHYYMADPFHEGQPPIGGNEYLTKVGERISGLFTAVDPKAIWVMQTWSMRTPIVEAVDKKKIILMNLHGSRWKGIPKGYKFTQGQLNNFGGRTHMHGDLENIARDLYTTTLAESKECIGVGMWTEGINDNPVNYHLAMEMNWAEGPVDVKSWLKNYTLQRYGASRLEFDQAWQLLLKGPYSRGGYGYSSMVAARPGLNPMKSGPNQRLKQSQYYDTKDLVKAWELLLLGADECRDSAGYRFDLADCGRQSLSNLATVFQRRIAKAFFDKDRAALNKAGKEFTELLDDIDKLISSCPEMLMGKWQADAMAWATTPEEKKYYASMGATLPTTWGSDTPDSSLYDYAWREWGGLVKTFYKKRWEIFIAELDAKLAAGKEYVDPPNTCWGRPEFRADDIHKKLGDFEDAYTANPPRMSAEAQGDTISIAKQLLAKYRSDFQRMHKGYPAPATKPSRTYWQGAEVKALTGEEFSAFGVGKEDAGIHVTSVEANSLAHKGGLKKDDVVQKINGKPTRTVEQLLQATNGDAALSITFVRGQARQKTTLKRFSATESTTVDESAALSTGLKVKKIMASTKTNNEPLQVLVDGKLAKNFGPVFGNEINGGCYKVDLGKAVDVKQIVTVSHNLNGTRGVQYFTLYGSKLEKDPNWNLENRNRFTPITTVDTRAAKSGSFQQTTVRNSDSSPLGKFRWLIWQTSLLNNNQENTCFQELTVKVAEASKEKQIPFSQIPIEASRKAESAESADVPLFPGKRSDFRGYDRYDHVKSATGHFSIVCPKNAAPGKPWLWRSLFWEAIKPFSNADLQLVDQGYHVVLAHGDVSGHPRGNANIDGAYELLTQEYGFSKKCSMASMSRGTLSLFRWATENPEKVESIYVDNGVCNVLSWPAGKRVPGNNSIGSGDRKSWNLFKRKFGYATDEEALKTKESPIDLLGPLAKAGVPILMVCGSKDPAVPYEENDAIMEQRYKALGGSIEVIVENKGHSHGMKDPTPVIEFIKKNTNMGK